ncbi:MAG: hypothetical protein D6714_05165 [Bacteroidetes bacterium]|nr:MAG: hypothetical protein D6714_05165 [Bacteroidota bacterium]
MRAPKWSKPEQKASEGDASIFKLSTRLGKSYRTLSKKKFTEGLESIFGDTSKDPYGGAALITEEQEPEVKTARKKRTRSRKNFTTDLDSLLEDALKDSFMEPEGKPSPEKGLEHKTKSAQHSTRPQKPLTGLDALIRRTVETSKIEVNDRTKKRITVVFEKEKIEKLKKIARAEKAYLKDIMDKIVSEFLRQYEVKKKPLD